MLKIALVCDWLVTYAGAERAFEQLIQCFPSADLFAVIDFLPPSQRHFLNNKPITTTFIQKLPFSKKLYKHYLPFMPLAIEQLDLRSYDVVISNSHAVAKGVITGPNQLHISYVHSPMRYAWDLQHQYLEQNNLTKGLKGLYVKYLLHKMRAWDQHSAHRADHLIGNSKYIAKRIWKTYKRKASVIYPPVNVESFEPFHQKENFYLTASRLVPYKRVELIVECFKNRNEKLVVIGDGPDMKKIKKIAAASSNIELLGFQSNDSLKHYLQRAKAFIFAAEEDFGILPLEAQACGTPVIAFGKGGALETVRGLDQEAPTGLFFYEQTVISLSNAIDQFERVCEQFSVENCVKQAQKFSVERFRKEFTDAVHEHCHSELC